MAPRITRRRSSSLNVSGRRLRLQAVRLIQTPAAMTGQARRTLKAGRVKAQLMAVGGRGVCRVPGQAQESFQQQAGEGNDEEEFPGLLHQGGRFRRALHGADGGLRQKEAELFIRNLVRIVFRPGAVHGIGLRSQAVHACRVCWRAGGVAALGVVHAHGDVRGGLAAGAGSFTRREMEVEKRSAPRSAMRWSRGSSRWPSARLDQEYLGRVPRNRAEPVPALTLGPGRRCRHPRRPGCGICPAGASGARRGAGWREWPPGREPSRRKPRWRSHVSRR